MITPQDIREKAFDRAVRGYDMEMVDEFLDDIADDYTALVKENNSLKSKMRVLAEKIEEYRQTEDSMRLALLSAQKMGAQIEAEARERAEKMEREAKTRAETIDRDAKASVANEIAKLNEAKKATQKYVDHMTAVCQKQIEFYGKLAEAKLVEAPKAEPVPETVEPEEDDEDTTVRAIEDSAVKSALKEPEQPINLDDLLGAAAQEEDEPTRMFAAEGGAKKRKRSRAEYLFDDED